MKRAPTKKSSKAKLSDKTARSAEQSTTPLESRRTKNKLDKQERIQEAALTLFIEKGFENTTTRSVAEKAGVGSGTLFLYASDKTDLLCMVMYERLAAATDRGFATIPARAPLLDQLIHVFVSLFQMYGSLPHEMAAAFVRVLPGARGPNADRVNALTFAFHARLASFLRDAQDRGDIAEGILLPVAAANLFAVYFMSLLGWIAGMRSLPNANDSMLRDAFALQIQGLSPRPSVR